MSELTVLVVDDEPLNLDLFERDLSDLGWRTESASSAEVALRKIAFNFPGVVVADVRMPTMDGLELLGRVGAIDPEIPVILVTAYGDVPLAVRAMREGAYDFIERPWDRDLLRETVRRALDSRALVMENRSLRAELASRAGLDAMILGSSPPMVELRQSIALVADTDASVLIRGETGTGKELVARSLHELSGRRGMKFVPTNCAAMPETLIEDELFGHVEGAYTNAKGARKGKFEHADGGTLFLDEIESVPLHLQVKLLRALQERKVEPLGSNAEIPFDARLVAATQIDLLEASEAGSFRSDLYYRLNVAEIHIPPLRDRRDDIPLLFDAFVRELSAQYDREAPPLSGEDVQALMVHAWPGNVRELRNVAERHVLGLRRPNHAFSNLVQSQDSAPKALRELVDAFEQCVIERELIRNRGNMQATAEALGVPDRTLYDRMRKHELKRTDYT